MANSRQLLRRNVADDSLSATQAGHQRGGHVATQGNSIFDLPAEIHGVIFRPLITQAADLCKDRRISR